MSLKKSVLVENERKEGKKGRREGGTEGKKKRGRKKRGKEGGRVGGRKEWLNLVEKRKLWEQSYSECILLFEAEG